MAYSSASARPQSQFRYPAMQAANAGRRIPERTDALGRALLRNDEAKNSSFLRFPAPNGVSAPKGPEVYAPDLNEQGGAGPVRGPVTPGGVPPGSPQHPGGIGQLSQADYARYLPETGGRRPPGARLQALAASRKYPNAWRT